MAEIQLMEKDGERETRWYSTVCMVWSAAIASGGGRWKKRELWNSVVWYGLLRV
jgi:hypothetical protein